jgi:hypothetical protein
MWRRVVLWKKTDVSEVRRETLYHQDDDEGWANL